MLNETPATPLPQQNQFYLGSNINGLRWPFNKLKKGLFLYGFDPVIKYMSVIIFLLAEIPMTKIMLCCYQMDAGK